MEGTVGSWGVDVAKEEMLIKRYKVSVMREVEIPEVGVLPV